MDPKALAKLTDIYGLDTNPVWLRLYPGNELWGLNKQLN